MMELMARNFSDRSTSYTPEIGEQLLAFVAAAASDPRVKQAVEDNHDSNRWWPPTINDWRMRLLVAGWSARISYSMIDTYAAVVSRADEVGFDRLALMNDTEVSTVVGSLGLHTARINYLRSLTAFLDKFGPEGEATMRRDPNTFIRLFARNVSYASYKVAQCATLYACGYHCGIIPVDSGMVDKLAGCLGWRFSRGPVAHEEMRELLERAATDCEFEIQGLIRDLDYRVTIPAGVAPTWWLHLVLIYYKRLYCTHRHPRDCPGMATESGARACRGSRTLISSMP